MLPALFPGEPVEASGERCMHLASFRTGSGRCRMSLVSAYQAERGRACLPERCDVGSGVCDASPVRARHGAPQERCELCSAGIAHEHPHLVEIALAPDRLRLRSLCDSLRWHGRRQIQARLPARSASGQLPDDRRAMGKSADSHQHGVLLPFEHRRPNRHALP